MYSIASDPCDYGMGYYELMMRAMDMMMMVIMEAMMIAMIKSRIGMRATILEDNIRKMVNIPLMVKMEKKKNLVVAPMMMREHVRNLTLTLFERCVKGLGSKRIDFPIFEGRRDPEVYLDWRLQCEQTFQNHDLTGQDRPLYALFYLKGLALGLWNQAGKAPNTPRKYPSIGMGKIEGADEVQVHSKLHYSKGGSLHGTTWTMQDLSIRHGGMIPNKQNGYKGVMDHWGTPLFPIPKVKNERQKIERSKGKQCGNLRVEKGEFERSEVRGLPQSQSNIYVRPSLVKDSYVGTSMMNGGTQVPNKESTIEGVMDALMGCPNIQVDPIDDRIDSSSKIDLCPPSVDTCALNDSSLSCDNCVDQPVYECGSLVEGSCNMIKKPHVCDIMYSKMLQKMMCLFEVFPPKDGNIFSKDKSTLGRRNMIRRKVVFVFPLPLVLGVSQLSMDDAHAVE
ncbi:hypothetical protein KY290_015652 [Solanum tuberosum]|uniref:Uncharacterized protein n=1 Tax=Solanum tuberosum TaxID=4113 RepID=A0ABQ7VT36_SOLTU|nr:hypothetical protein KY284_014976 [Solanum tuberosum]KAH0771671.1 hypothetical protein KY290_015652 [Solanum tuberosum]